MMSFYVVAAALAVAGMVLFLLRGSASRVIGMLAWFGAAFFALYGLLERVQTQAMSPLDWAVLVIVVLGGLLLGVVGNHWIQRGVRRDYSSEQR